MDVAFRLMIKAGGNAIALGHVPMPGVLVRCALVSVCATLPCSGDEMRDRTRAAKHVRAEHA